MNERLYSGLCPVENAGKHWTLSQRRSNTKQWVIHHILTEKRYPKSDNKLLTGKKVVKTDYFRTKLQWIILPGSLEEVMNIFH